MKSAKSASGKTSKKAIKKGDLEPKLKKTVLYLLSSNSNNPTKQLLKSLYQLNREHGVFRVDSGSATTGNETPLKLTLNPKNHRLAEMICNKLSLGMYIVANSNKKRPMNMGFGRLYDGQLLDCCQLKVVDYKLCEHFKADQGTIASNSRPLVIAQGSEFSQDSGPLNTLRSILFDVFRGPNYGKLSLENVKHVIVLTLLDDFSSSTVKNNSESSLSNDNQANSSVSTDGHMLTNGVGDGSASTDSTSKSGQWKLLFRRYAIALTKSSAASAPSTNSTGLNLPNVTLNEVGPSIDFLVEEIIQPEEETFKLATKLPKKPKKLVAGLSVAGDSSDHAATSHTHTGLKHEGAGTHLTADGSVKASSGKHLKSKGSKSGKGHKGKRHKNLKTTALGSLQGKVYVNRQDLSELYTRHSKLKRKTKKAPKH